MSVRSDQQKAEFMGKLNDLLNECHKTQFDSSPKSLEALMALGEFVENNKAKITETLQRHIDFRTHEEWQHDEDEAYFDEEYD